MMQRESNASFFSSIFSRELLGRQVIRRPFVQDLSCEGECSGTIASTASGVRNAPVFGLQYAQYTYNKLLAIADEDGYISIVNTASTPPAALNDEDSPNKPCAQWNAHQNAIFDLAWANADSWMYTASGDMTVALWDTGVASRICSFTGHGGSVKSLSVSPHGPEVFATGARDGMLMLWDARMGACTCVHRSPNTRHPMMHVKEPHAIATPRVRGRRRDALQGRPRPSVTAVQFLSSGTGHTLCSGGVDGKVKFWDVRYSVQPTVTLPPVPLADVVDTFRANLRETNREASLTHLTDTTHPQLGERNHAVTNLALHPDGCQLLVSLTGGHHLLYDVARPESGPIKWFGGHTVSSFYIKAAFSPDGSHFVSGSSDANAYIWQVNDSDGTRPYMLRGHEGEVTAATWCPSDFGQLATAADDYTIKVWNIRRQQPVEERDMPAVSADKQEFKTSWTPPVGVATTATTAAAAAAQAPDDIVGILGDEAMPARHVDEVVTPVVAPAAAESVQLAQQTSMPVPRGGQGGQLTNTAATASTTGQMRISNALRLAADRPLRKRTKQQTIAEALFAARGKNKGRADAGAGAAGQKRPRSACSESGESESRASQDENAPMNVP